MAFVPTSPSRPSSSAPGRPPTEYAVTGTVLRRALDEQASAPAGNVTVQVFHQDVAGATVAELLVALDGTVPGLRDRLVESGPRLRPHINVFVDGEPGDLASPVGAASVVHVLPAMSGG